MLSGQQQKLFITLYERCNVTRAASELYLSRQAVSAGLSKLEAQLGVRLFERTTTGLKPTAAAGILYDYSVKQEALWRRCDEELQANRVRTLRIGRHLVHCSPEMIKEMVSFSEASPSTTVEFHDIGDYSEAQKQVLDGRLDIAMARKIPTNPALQVVGLYMTPVDVLVAQDGSLARKGVVDFHADLDGLSVIFVSKETMEETRSYMPEGAHALLIPPDRALLCEMVASGEAVFPFPRHARSAFEGRSVTSVRSEGWPGCGVASLICSLEPSSVTREFIAYWTELQHKKGSRGNFLLPGEEGYPRQGSRCPYAAIVTTGCHGCGWAAAQ